MISTNVKVLLDSMHITNYLLIILFYKWGGIRKRNSQRKEGNKRKGRCQR